jgi:uncharacterized glyoxalase superfamily protein PhnB
VHLEAVGMGGIVGAAVRGARCGADAGVAISMPLTEKQWGERAFQVRDPNGVIVQLLDWNAAIDGGAEI